MHEYSLSVLQDAEHYWKVQCELRTSKNGMVLTNWPIVLMQTN